MKSGTRHIHSRCRQLAENKHSAMIWFFAFLIFGVVIAYYLGKRDGIVETNRRLITRGVWIEVKEKIIVKQINSAIKLQPGTQGLVTNVNIKNGYFNIWIGRPWLEMYSNVKGVYGISMYSKVKIKNVSEVGVNVVSQTIKDLKEWETKTDQMYSEIFPTEWLEIQSLLNK